MSAVVNPRLRPRTSAVSCPKAGAGAPAGGCRRTRPAGRGRISPRPGWYSGKPWVGGHFRSRCDLGERSVPLEQHRGARSAAVISSAVWSANQVANKPTARRGTGSGPPRTRNHTQRIGERRHRGTGARHLDQVAKVPAGQRDNHEPGTVMTGEVLPVLTIDGVAQPLALRTVDLRFGQQPQVPGSGQGDILQCQADLRARTGLSRRRTAVTTASAAYSPQHTSQAGNT